jgi:aspartyl-tRNA synthetase
MSLRTHTCGELTQKDINKEITLCGWIQKIRDHGGLLFIDLRDRYGITQIILPETKNSALYTQAKLLGREYCIQITGTVKNRNPKDYNKNLATGEIEIELSSLNILNKSEVPPIPIEDKADITDDIRLKYRFLDLRRDRIKKNLIFRHEAKQIIKKSLIDLDFLEIETPLLVKSTPEGARDFVVPSRLYPGKFYALPQSPQLYKQLLMVSGFDRYFQFAHCFRDEDLRADRAFVHTQIDMEMSFVQENDIFYVVEYYLKNLFKDLMEINLTTPFPKISYEEAIGKYGVDKPDLRFALELVDITNILSKSSSEIFNNIIKSKGIIKGIKINQNLSRKDIDELNEFVKIYGAKGIFYTKLENNHWHGGVGKFLEGEVGLELIKKFDAKNDDIIVICADKKEIVNASLGNLRNKIASKFKLFNENQNYFVWVTDFPMFSYNEELKIWEPMHHIFTKPKDDHVQYLDTDPGKVLGQLYDLVLNGVELLSGSIRINTPELQKKIFNIINMKEEEADVRFGFLLNAFKYGAPPHGGCALGFDRLIALMRKETSIREVIAFPNNASGIYPVDGSPSNASEEQLKELHLKIMK